MADYIRNNAWNNSGTFDNLDLFWYAKGVAAMQARPLNDPLSWWFFAAIHGQYVTEEFYPGWQFVPSPPTVPTSPLPDEDTQNQFWDQCQHQSWYFLPWHRGYIYALEHRIRRELADTRDFPAQTWALPYWNYFGVGLQNTIPPAFTLQYLPDGTTPNPLLVSARYGPTGNGQIYIPSDVDQACMANDLYTGSDPTTLPPGFGGPRTTLFTHFGQTSGNLEFNPHNLVHGYVGGHSSDPMREGQPGLMADLGLAALDPIFYLHHSNIDRMWAAWNQTNGNRNPSDPAWQNGPTNRQFAMPWGAGGEIYTFAPSDLIDYSRLNYTYDDLSVPVPVAATLAQRLTKLGATAAQASAQEGTALDANRNAELVGANQETVAIKGAEARTTVKLDSDVLRKVSASLAAAETAQPDMVYLNLENVRGTADGSVLHVYINLAGGAEPGDHPELLAGSIGLFGLRRATSTLGGHSGQGLSYLLDITRIIDALYLDHALDVDSLQVTIIPHRPVPESVGITVGRVSVYRQGF